VERSKGKRELSFAGGDIAITYEFIFFPSLNLWFYRKIEMDVGWIC